MPLQHMTPLREVDVIAHPVLPELMRPPSKHAELPVAPEQLLPIAATSGFVVPNTLQP